MIRKISIAFALLMSASSPSQAHEPRTVSQVVPSADLDLSTAAGVRTLQRRIARTAREICMSASLEPLSLEVDERRCYRDAVASAQPRLERAAAAAQRRVAQSLAAR